MSASTQPPGRFRALGRYVIPILTLLAALVLWESAVRLFEIPKYLIPAPTQVALTIAHSWPSLFKDAGVTLGEAALGFALGTSFAFVVGAAFVHSQLIEDGLAPYMVALQAVPIVAMAPLLIIWFGNGLLSKIVMAAIICFFPMVVTSAAGLRLASSDALDLMRVLSASKWQVFLKLRLPASLPFVFSGLRISATLSVIGAVVAELAGATRGIGYQIMISSYQTDTPTLFAAVLFSAITGIGFYYAVTFVETIIMSRLTAKVRKQ